jgi:hypothetical protein
MKELACFILGAILTALIIQFIQMNRIEQKLDALENASKAQIFMSAIIAGQNAGMKTEWAGETGVTE